MSRGRRVSTRDASWLAVESAKVVGPLSVVPADAVRRAGGTPTRVPTAAQAVGEAWLEGQKTPGVPV